MSKNMFARASAGLNLTPMERAALRMLEGLAATAVVAGITAAAPLLAGGSVDWANVGHVALAAGITAALLAILKYAKAFGDAPITEPVPAGAPDMPPTQAGA